MKFKDGWVLTKQSDEYAAVPTRESAESFSGIVRLNETGKDIWEGISDGLTVDEIAAKLVDLYDGVDLAKAEEEVNKVVQSLIDEGILE